MVNGQGPSKPAREIRMIKPPEMTTSRQYGRRYGKVLRKSCKVGLSRERTGYERRRGDEESRPVDLGTASE
jgi:hypothetical protein